jgi:peroxiredoxin/outer membrane lipoprotein-sorting protein
LVSRFSLLRAGAAALCALVPAAAQTLSAPEILKRVATTYQNLKAIDVVAQQELQVIGRGGASASGASQLTFALAEGGRYLIAVKAPDREYTMVSDGSTTWRYVPKSKQWSKEEASAAADEDSGAEDAAPAGDGKDPLSQMRRMFIDRYTKIDRLAAAARLDRDDHVKVDGAKIDCYKLVITLPATSHELLIDKERFLVVRHVELRRGADAEQRMSITAKRLDTAQPPPSTFSFSPPPKTVEVSMLILPGEDRPDLVGKAAADFTLKSLDGEKVTLSDLRGKIVLLDFWATWCPPCRRELPSVAKLNATLRERNVVVLGINDESSGTVKSFLKKNSLELPVLMDGNGGIHKLYGARAIPTVVVINPTGVITAYYVGARSEEDLMSALQGAGLER